MLRYTPGTECRRNNRARRWLNSGGEKDAKEELRMLAAFYEGGEELAGTERLVSELRHRFDFFSEMSRPEVETLLGLCGRRFFGPGRVIFEKDEVEEVIYFIVFGEVVFWGDGLEKDRRGPGDLVGDLTGLLGAPRRVTAFTRKSTLLIAMPRSLLVGERPKLRGALLRKFRKQISAWLRRASPTAPGRAE